MLCNTKNMLCKARKNKYAVAHFNINNLEWTKYILEECNKLNCPVILGVSRKSVIHMGGYNTISNLVKGLIEDLNIEIEVALHLDHGKTFEECKDALEAGFTSLMIDASNFSLAKNISITKKIVEYAKKFDATVEAEIGLIGDSGEDKSIDIIYNDVLEVEKLVNETCIDSLAPAVGSIHGLYKEEPKINYNRIKEIYDRVNIPLVLHGASGLNDDILKNSINNGISKINIQTDLQVVWAKAVRRYLKKNVNEYDPRKIIAAGEEAIKKEINHKIFILGCYNKSQKFKNIVAVNKL